MQNLIFQSDFVSQGCMKKKLHAKICQNGTIALFNYFCLSELFATLYIIRTSNIESCKKFGQTELIKKSNCLDISGNKN